MFHLEQYTEYWARNRKDEYRVSKNSIISKNNIFTANICNYFKNTFNPRNRWPK